MRRATIPFLLLALAGCRTGPTGGADEPTPDPPPLPLWTADMQAVADGNTRFALDLYGQLRTEPGNVFVSPYSAHAALAMTAHGGRGPTRDQMTRVLHLPADPEKALAGGDLGRYYSAPGQPYELAVANAVWGEKSFPWRPEFRDALAARYGAGLRDADFATNPDGERRRINAWAEEATRGKVRDVLPEGRITRDHRMVLANAIYFKADWAEPFEEHRTRPGPFTLADGTKKTTPLMHRDGGFRWHRHVGAGTNWLPELAVAELPYKGGKMSMVVLLPGKPDGLPALEAKLTPEALAGWLAEMKDAGTAEMLLPKFRLETGYDLNRPLKALGMTAAFDPAAADFTGMHSSAERLFVDFVAQKAFVDVNEAGTEAAGVSIVGAKLASATPSFRADRPFLFLIRDAEHGTVLFVGRVADPTK